MYNKMQYFIVMYYTLLYNTIQYCIYSILLFLKPLPIKIRKCLFTDTVSVHNILFTDRVSADIILFTDSMKITNYSATRGIFISESADP